MHIQNINNMYCMILCGGKGTRLRDVTELLPKPMVSIGEFPIVYHIMKWYSKFGIKKFILCLGYKKEVFINYFTNFINNTSDIKIDLKNNKIDIFNKIDLDWEITLVDTGLETKTGKRIKLASKYLNNEDNFFMTYGDGVSNINIKELYQDHLKSNKLLTLTSVNIPSRFGLIEMDNDNNIIEMHEKNKSDGYINGGYMVINKKFIDKYLNKYDDVFFEAEPINDAIKDNNIHSYIHNDFWQCMDNLKEYEYLNSLWKKNIAKWK